METPVTLTPPGQLFRRDFRPAGQATSAGPENRPIKLLQWNIERGYQLPGIIEELRRLDADLISLQEVDSGCERSGGGDTGLAIAAALELDYVFLSEFEEIHSPLRDAATQGGGMHGNAILSKFTISEAAVVPHRTHPVDWNNPTHALARREPRRGKRAVLRATVDTPQGPLVVYNAHLEVFCGLLARIAQLSDIFADARRMADGGLHHQAILGDMNTMAHGIARLSPNYCCDRMRFRSIGLDEAMVWHRYVLPVTDLRYTASSAHCGTSASAGLSATSASKAASDQPAAAAASAAAAAAAAVGEPNSTVSPPINRQLLAWGLDVQVARDAVNPGFHDPFDPATTTLDNPKYRFLGFSLMKGKLDWVLLRRMAVTKQDVGNLDFSLSDHRWLAAEVTLD
ncbi:hypothetical protein D9Q98_006426 [Chlorella vulgaris]|uniref:Endonuclease/exonuclease/phosphatase domain-containing protein n=1 Tax=Chlorella vulgaris TaxID=3077 RepID=A0A9D4YVA9_CHLVU|nr:hypothetical protein D9Q98_006426 [Chlorella vulgaris]